MDRRAALVTGSSRGIGRAVALLLAQQGHDVMIHYRADVRAAGEAVRLMRATGGRASSVCADLAMDEAPHIIVDATITQFGRIDVLVNCAAALWYGSPETLQAADFASMYRINVWSPYGLMVAVSAHLTAGGRIINISSDAVHFPRARVAAYAASKAALESLTRSFAEFLGPRGITVNAVAPGPTRTDMLEPLLAKPEVAEEFRQAAYMGRLAEPDEIAQVVAFLASDKARWITGQVIEVSGGRTH